MRRRKATAQALLADFDAYLAAHDCSATPTARKIIERMESTGEQFDRDPYDDGFLLAILQESATVRAAVDRLGGDAVRAIELLHEHATRPDIEYAETGWYTEPEGREQFAKLGTVDLAITAAVRRGKRKIGEIDLLEALLRYVDATAPVTDNAGWRDERLQTSYNTLSHIYGAYCRELDVKFRVLLADLGVAAAPVRSPVDEAPLHVRASLIRFLEDHPEYDRNCFLMMALGRSPDRSRVYTAIRRVLGDLRFTVLRADQRRYSDDLLTNVETYIHGCAFGISVHERIESETQNPNVALEIGYLLGIGKPVCLLKERTVPSLPVDLMGRLYVEFDLQRLRPSLRESLTRWLEDYRFIR